MTTAVIEVTDQDDAVYSAERALQWIYSNAAESTYVELSGVYLQLEPESRFGDLESIQRYVDRVTAMPGVVAKFGPAGRVNVYERESSELAHYQGGSIFVHTLGNNADRWAMRELIVLHELAHHYSPGFESHGPDFTNALLSLVGMVIGPQAALALRIFYDAEEVKLS